jgi:hypothetical protein
MTVISRMVFAAFVLVSLSAPAAAQTTVTQADIQRLQDNVYLAERDLAQLRSRDTAGAAQIQAEVDELRDEVIYLKVKLRKERSLARTEYADVRDRIEDVRTRARGDAAGRYAVPPVAQGSLPSPPARNTINVAGTTEIPAGTELDVRLQGTLSSGTALVEDRFEATTLTDLVMGGRVVVPSGSVMRGVVTAVEPASRTNRTSSMTVSFDQVTVGGRAYPIRGTVTETIEAGGVGAEAGRTAAGAGVGAIIGGILGGVKGAVIGGVIGGGGTIAATEGKQVELPQGTVLRVRIDSPVQIQGR